MVLQKRCMQQCADSTNAKRNELAVARPELPQSGLPGHGVTCRHPVCFCMACSGVFSRILLMTLTAEVLRCALRVWHVLVAVADAIACSLHGSIKVTLCGWMAAKSAVVWVGKRGRHLLDH